MFQTKTASSADITPTTSWWQARLLALALGTLLLSLSAWVYELTSQRDTPLWALAVLLLFAASVALLLSGARSQPPRWLLPRAPRRLRPLLLAVATATTLSVLVTFALATAIATTSAGRSPLYNSDAAAFNHYNAELVLHGINPYTADARFWDAVRQFPNVGATPLQRGRYAGSALGPSLDQIVRDVRVELTDPTARGPEYAPASLHSYPALAFLVYVPGVWAGLPTTFLTSLAFLIAFVAAAVIGAPARMHLPLAGIVLANTFLVVYTLRGSFEVVALLPTLLAWRMLDRPRVSPLLLGLAGAVKQTVWPLALLYAVIVWRRDGARAALMRLALAICAFLAPNLPFIIASPGAWAASMLLPIALPIFPSGMGIVALARAGLLPLWPTAVYTALELTALAGIALWLACTPRPPHPALALVLGLLPFMLAWHSLFAYVIVLPTLTVFAAEHTWVASHPTSGSDAPSGSTGMAVAMPAS